MGHRSQKFVSETTLFEIMKQETAMDGKRMRVYFENECPRIGSGWRIVQVLEGRKWTRFAASAGRGKVAKAVWAQMQKIASELPPAKRRRRKAVA